VQGGETVSSDLYEVLSLAARYLFTLLGVLIVMVAAPTIYSYRLHLKQNKETS